MLNTVLILVIKVKCVQGLTRKHMNLGIISQIRLII